jgi:hypothetical protein
MDATSIGFAISQRRGFGCADESEHITWPWADRRLIVG